MPDGCNSRCFFAGFEVLTAVVMKSSLFWDITPCCPLEVNRRFRGTCRLHLQGLRIIQARNTHVAGSKFGLFLDPEDGGDMLLRIAG
jgi:hypothetical protein